VVIPNSVTVIGDRAFEGNQIISVTIGNRVAVGNRAFFGEGQRRLLGEQLVLNEHITAQEADGVMNGFRNLYLRNERRAGTYTLSNGRWSAQFR